MIVQPLRCCQCGAGLTDPGDASFIPCAYCKHVHAVHRTAPARGAAQYTRGQAVVVYWGRSWWDARVLAEVGPQRWRIHYDGYGSGYDEDVGPDRIRPRDDAAHGGGPEPQGLQYPAGSAVDVLWKQRWYPGVVLRAEGPAAWLIHYEGYNDSWDEIVGPARIRPRSPAALEAQRKGCGAVFALAAFGALAALVATVAGVV